jgi:signal peptidase
VAASLALATVAGTGLTLWLQGFRLYVVHTGSMTPTYRPGDLVVDGPPSGSYQPGQVLTFRHSDRTTDVVTHRVVGITAAGGIHTKGDANATPDAWTIRPDQVQGQVRFGLRDLGYLAVYFQQPAGVASVATGAAAILLLWNVFFSAERSEEDPEPAREPAPGDEWEPETVEELEPGLEEDRDVAFA